MVSLSLCAAVLFLAQRAAAQNHVTPVVMPTPPGQFIAVNNSPGADHYDPHVSDDLVAYWNSDGTNFTIRYFDLLSLTDRAIQNSFFLTFDLLPDVRGPIIAFSRVIPGREAIFTFDTSAVNAQPVEIAPQADTVRESAQIGDQTIAWVDFGVCSISPCTPLANIVAYDRPTGATTIVAPASFPLVNHDQ